MSGTMRPSGIINAAKAACDECDHQQQLAALAAVSASAQPLVFYTEVRASEPEDSYSLTAKPYSFLAAGFRSRVPDDYEEDAPVSVEPGVSALLSETAVVDTASRCSSGSEDVASVGASEVAVELSMLDRLSSSMDTVLQMGAPALSSVVASCALACTSVCSYFSRFSATAFGFTAACASPGELESLLSSASSLASTARVLGCYIATAKSPSGQSEHSSPRERPWIQPGPAGREAALRRGQDASFADRLNMLRDKLASLHGPDPHLHH